MGGKSTMKASTEPKIGLLILNYKLTQHCHTRTRLVMHQLHLVRHMHGVKAIAACLHAQFVGKTRFEHWRQRLGQRPLPSQACIAGAARWCGGRSAAAAATVITAAIAAAAAAADADAAAMGAAGIWAVVASRAHVAAG